MAVEWSRPACSTLRKRAQMGRFGCWTAASMMLAGIVGCGQPKPGSHAKMEPHEYSFHAMTGVDARRMSVFDIAEQNEFKTKEPVKIVVTWTSSGSTKLHRYEGLVLPLDNAEFAEWTFMPSVDATNFDWPGIHVHTGWLYLVGNMPLAKTDEVVAAADGSQIVLKVEVEPDGDKVDHVIFLDGEKVDIHYGAASPHTITTFKYYREYKNGVLQGVGDKDLDAAYGLKQFIEDDINDAAVATNTQSPRL